MRRKVLVTIFQRGAMDGLAAVPPIADRELRRLRPRLHLDSVTDLENGFGLHPALADLLPLFRDGRLAVVHAMGSPDPTRSHFDAQDYMETGTPGRKGTRDGWLFAWRTTGSADSIQWEGRHHDARGTSNFEVPLPDVREQSLHSIGRTHHPVGHDDSREAERERHEHHAGHDRVAHLAIFLLRELLEIAGRIGIQIGLRRELSRERLRLPPREVVGDIT